MSIEYLGNNRARLRVSLGSDSKGTRIQRSKIVTYKMKRDVPKMYQEFLEECGAISAPVGSVSELLSKYNSVLRNVKMLRETTMYGYETCEKRINKSLGAFSAKDVETYQIDNFVAQMSKKGLSPKTIRNTINYLSGAYKYGIRSKMVATNPCLEATLPPEKKPKIQIVEEDNVDRMLKALKNEPLDMRVSIELALFEGLRRSEIAGLKESSVDTKECVVRITETRHWIKGRNVVQPTKTERSERTLALPRFIADDIQALIDEHHSNDYNNTDYLIQHFGEPVKPQYITNFVSRFNKRNGIDKATLHGLRHTFATMLNASKQFDIAEISSALGHSDISVTINTYMHVFQGASKSSQGIADFMDSQQENSKSTQKGVRKVSTKKLKTL